MLDPRFRDRHKCAVNQFVKRKGKVIQPLDTVDYSAAVNAGMKDVEGIGHGQKAPYRSQAAVTRPDQTEKGCHHCHCEEKTPETIDPYLIGMLVLNLADRLINLVVEWTSFWQCSRFQVLGCGIDTLMIKTQVGNEENCVFFPLVRISSQ